MGYNPKEAKVLKGLPPGVTQPAVIIDIADGKVDDFVTAKGKEKWNNLEQPAINVSFEVKYNEDVYKFEKMFPYKTVDGKTQFGEKSDLGKYHKYFGKLPEVADTAKAITNSDGYWRVLLE